MIDIIQRIISSILTARAEMSKVVEQLKEGLDANVAAHTTANGDYAAEVIDARVDAHSEVHENLDAYMRLAETSACTTRIDGFF